MCLYKQDSENASDPKYARVLNVAFSEYGRVLNMPVTQRSEYARICLDRVLNISWVLNMPGF